MPRRNGPHTSRRRSDHVERVFHELGLMEREGSGFDLMYERLLVTGRGAPVAEEGVDSVHVTIPRRVVSPAVIRLMAEADQRYQLTQRERIALGLLAQSEGLTAAELAVRLELEDPRALRTWIGRLIEVELLQLAGRTRGTRYFVAPGLLREVGLDGPTTLRRVEPHRLRALILEDLRLYPDSSRVEIHRRIGSEIHPKTLTRALDALMREERVEATGERRWRRYRLRSNGRDA